MRNLKIATRLSLIAFVGGIVSAVIVIVSCFNLYNLSHATTQAYNTVSVPMNDLIIMNNSFSKIGLLIGVLYENEDEAANKSAADTIQTAIAELESASNQYLDALKNDGTTSGPEYDTLKKMIDTLPNFKNTMSGVILQGTQPNSASHLASAESAILPLSQQLSSAIAMLGQINAEQDKQVSLNATKILKQGIIIVVAAFIVGLGLLLIFSMRIIKSIKDPLQAMVHSSLELAKGNVDVQFPTGLHDEIGDVSRSFSTVANAIKVFLADINTSTDALDAGDIESRLTTEKHFGAFEQAAKRINLTFDSFISDMLLLIGALESIGTGDFNIVPKVLPGKKIVLTETVNKVLANLKTMDNELNSLITCAAEGQLHKRAAADKLAGGWHSMLTGLNLLLDEIVKPIEESSQVLKEVAKGNLKVHVEGDYKGDFLQIKTDLNTTIQFLSTYILEIKTTLSALSNNNFDLSIDREYVGDFSEIKTSINTIIDKLNYVLLDIHAATNQVSAGARQISESSMSLAEGATDQGNSIQGLTHSLSDIHAKIKTTAENAKRADDLSNISKQNASLSNDEMQKMLLSMDEIKLSSNNISGIIKVIEEIAFQTKILALNAAVEAARAGSHGKGFASVADEVKNLANRSRIAANETTLLINDSIHKVEEGTQIAKETAESLNKIVNNVAEVSSIVGAISEACVEQEIAVEEIGLGLSEISEVVQHNTATSEESASAAEELSSQSELLKTMASSFKLRK